MEATSNTIKVSANMKPGRVGNMYTLRCVSVMLSDSGRRDCHHFQKWVCRWRMGLRQLGNARPGTGAGGRAAVVAAEEEVIFETLSQQTPIVMDSKDRLELKGASPGMFITLVNRSLIWKQ